ncbi:transcriptional repressor NrdR [archaeon]|jgi:transcriptional repressor NrdR|nr:transcriptional repressor NrdR [archaeon]MBT6823931.1 transcriptional repressor NrdR [archaeon]MBT7107161.1 transcriptional repressor NrdR [archaeon]MBT7297769.1 transcriptional repressor NrdR [archaeon]
MKCQFCSSGKSKVIDKRNNSKLSSIRRRRECLKCGKRYTTYERISQVNLKIIKRNGKREPFDRTKLLLGLSLACKKRPISEEDLDMLISDIEAELRSNDTPEINSSILGEMALNKLKKLDSVAFLRFASLHHEFEDVESFKKEIGRMKNENRTIR